MGVYEAIKDALKVAQASDNAPLIKSLTAALMESHALSERLYELKARVRELEEALSERRHLVFDGSKFYRAEGDEIPYCRVCWESEKKALHLEDWGRGDWHCRICRNTFNDGTGPGNSPVFVV